MTSDDDSSTNITPLFRTLMNRIPAALVERVAARPWLTFVIRIASLLVLFMFVDYFMRRAGAIGADGYQQPFLVVGIYHRLGSFLTLGMVAAALVLARYGCLLSRWSSLEHGGEIRWFVTFLVAFMAWAFSAYEYNFYFDRGHYPDRALIVLLVPLVFWRPVFVFPFLLLAFAVMWQIGEPSLAFGSVFPHKLQVLHVLNLFAAAFLIHAATGMRQMRDFLLFALSLVGAAYWVSIVSKLELGWLSHGHLYHMPIAAWSHGWLAFLPAETIVRWAKSIAWLDWPMMLFVLAFQAGFLFVLWRRPVSMILLAAAIIFHVGVFLLYGYFFWTWMLLNAALLVLLYRDRNTNRFDIYRKEYLLASVLLVATGSYWCSPSGLGWLDTRLTYTFRIEAIGESGTRYTLPPRYFAPYDSIVAMGNFRYLVEDFGLLVGPYGVSRTRERADEIQPLRTAEEVFALERAIGEVRHDPQHAAEFTEFVARYVVNRTASPDRGRLFELIGPPPQFWSYAGGDVFEGQEPVRSIAVISVTTLFDGERLEVIREHEVARRDLHQDIFINAVDETDSETTPPPALDDFVAGRQADDGRSNVDLKRMTHAMPNP